MGQITLDPLRAFTLAILCNGLVCLAVWLTWSARTTTDKVFVIVPPITAFTVAPQATGGARRLVSFAPPSSR